MNRTPCFCRPSRRAFSVVLWAGVATPIIAAAADPAPGEAPPVAAAAASRPSTSVDPRREVIEFLERRVADDPDDMMALNRLCDEYLGRFRRAGDDADIARAATAAERSLAAVPAMVNKGGLAARARVSMALHRFDAARDDARQLLEIDPGRPYAPGLLGDALLELGDVDGAAGAYRQMREAAGEGGEDAVAHVRLARLALALGRRDEAGRHFDAAVKWAESDAPPADRAVLLTWALVRAGYFAFSGGDWATAERRYLAALEVSPDDWPAADHLAELRAAQKRYDESVSLYTRLAERFPRPELCGALGDVYVVMNKPADAAAWHDRALAGYLRAAGAGHALYDHHLAGFYADVRRDGPEAVRWAQKDLARRRTPATLDALAWALYADGQFEEAARTVDEALALPGGATSAHVLYHGSLIHARRGDANRARDLARRAAEVNPKFLEFHVHR